ncbi:hypothetical protein [Streptomyces reniochalinae]|uniref:hypothetical protein n=1 Tax=Streptomyces reniochalinae TaxID=2250578 RepID=UPI0015F0D457|nr:hypothetical protein [Streptomyces reniochalinae]
MPVMTEAPELDLDSLIDDLDTRISSTTELPETQLDTAGCSGLCTVLVCTVIVC